MKDWSQLDTFPRTLKLVYAFGAEWSMGGPGAVRFSCMGDGSAYVTVSRGGASRQWTGQVGRETLLALGAELKNVGFPTPPPIPETVLPDTTWRVLTIGSPASQSTAQLTWSDGLPGKPWGMAFRRLDSLVDAVSEGAVPTHEPLRVR